MKIVVERMFERCYATGEFKQALGIALETRRLDHVEECFAQCTEVLDILAYCFDVCRNIITNRDFRMQVYEVMVKVRATLSTMT